MEWGSVIGAGISAIGSLAGGAINSAGQQAANDRMMQFNAQEAQKNREFQWDLSSTAYRRGMADMKAAGLNPILAYSQGGASATGGAQASVNLENALEGLGQGVTSAGQIARNVADLSNIKARTEAEQSQAKLNEANTSLSAAATAKAMQDTQTSAAAQRREDANTALLTEQVKNPAAQRMLWGAQAHSAATQAALNQRMLEDRTKYGDSVMGREFGSIERIGRRFGSAVVEGTKRLMDAHTNWSAKSVGMGGPRPGATPLEIDIYKEAR